MTHSDRRSTYRLLASVYGGRFHAESPEEAGALRIYTSDFPHQSEDDRAADHEALFGLNVFPYASVFLEEDGMLGGSVTLTAGAFRKRAGAPFDGQNPPDHIESELALLAHLSGSEDTPEKRDLFSEFVDTHVLGWLPAFTRAVCAENQPHYGRIARKTLDVIVSHRMAYDVTCMGSYPILSALSSPIEEASSGLGEIARFLTTPVRCGLYLSRSSIGRLSRGRRLPHGFGGRAQMMDTLLRSAVTYDALGHVIEKVRLEIAEARAIWLGLGRKPLESAKFWSAFWTARLELTESVMDELAEAAGASD